MTPVDFCIVAVVVVVFAIIFACVPTPRKARPSPPVRVPPPSASQRIAARQYAVMFDAMWAVRRMHGDAMTDDDFLRLKQSAEYIRRRMLPFSDRAIDDAHEANVIAATIRWCAARLDSAGGGR